MLFHSVEMLDALPSETKYYDIAAFASGFEARSTHLAKLIGRDAANSNIVLGFRDGLTILSREANDQAFLKELGVTVEVPLLGEDEHYLCSRLDALVQLANGKPLKLLIDYSVMTRAWYGALLTWARFSEYQGMLEIDFVYTYGEYQSEFNPLSISEIVSLPGFEGVSGGFRSTAAIFGLGYDKYATLAVYDRLEADIVYCCIAQRSAQDPNSEKVSKDNAVIIDAATKTFVLPLGDLSSAFRLMCEHVLLLDQNNHIVMVPMGPKTHVLVTLLVALRMPWITCLHAKGTRAEPVQVEATGELSIARVRFQPSI
jgi:hypothetical protein